ncbi:MAG: hypothetical protein WB729_22380 [Candidatus Sulfotelmatobacter sp.]
MSYRDGLPIQDRTPSMMVRDLRAHAETWRQFREATSSSPALSIVAYIVPFVVAIGGIGLIVFFGSRRHMYRQSLGWWPFILVAFPFIWRRFVERAVWNHELRQKSISSSIETWDVTQFPSDESRRTNIHTRSS